MEAKKSVLSVFFSAALLCIFLGWSAVSAYSTAPQTQGNILYVKPSEDGTCASWADACELQTALNTAEEGDQIWAAAGTYKPTSGTDRTATFLLESGVAIYGGFAGTESSLTERDWEANLTTLSGDIGTEGNNTDNSFHVVTGSGLSDTTILDGFTITVGIANSSNPNNMGGGMYIADSYLTLRNIKFSGNSASFGGGIFIESGNSKLVNILLSGNSAGEGGGIYNSTSDSSLTNVTFSGNIVSGCGGGMYNAQSNPSLDHVTFNENSALIGGGMCNNSSSPTLTNVTFYKNTASPTYEGYGGGGMYNGDSNPILVAVNFSENSAYDGGGMFNWNSDPVLKDVSFSANSASYYGGGIYNYNLSNPILNGVTLTENSAHYGGGISSTDYSSPTLTNVTMFGNSAPNGGGIYTNGESSTLTNVTIVGNSASVGGGILNVASNLTIRNAIIWGNTGGQISNQYSSTPIITYSNIQGGGFAGDGNINVDPLLGDLADNGGFTQTMALGENSPAIDAGDPNNCPATDQRNFLRPVDGNGDSEAVCDMGAYEYGSDPVLYSLTVDKVGEGEVTKDPDQIEYQLYDQVTLTATADPGWTFTGWDGDASGDVNPLTIIMDANKSITAYFTEETFDLFLPLILR